FYELLTTHVSNPDNTTETVFIPQLTSQSTPEAYTNQLALRRSADGGQWFEFRRKFGNTLRFPVLVNHEAVGAGVRWIKSDRQGKAWRKRSYFRVQEVADRFGGVLTYTFSGGNASLIPDLITEGRRGLNMVYLPQPATTQGPGNVRH